MQGETTVSETAPEIRHQLELPRLFSAKKWWLATSRISISTLWLCNIAMEHGPFTDDDDDDYGYYYTRVYLFVVCLFCLFACLFVWLMIYRLHMVIFRHDQLADASWNSPKLGDCQLLTMYRPCLCTSDGRICTCIHYIHCMALQCIALHSITYVNSYTQIHT